MWAEIFKALGVLLKYVAGDDRRRRSFAKELIQILLSIDRLVRQGTKILTEISSGNQLIVADLVEQLKTIQAIFDSLGDPKIQAVLRIQLPAMAQLDYYWLDIKWNTWEEWNVIGFITDLSGLSASRLPFGDPKLVGVKDQDLVLVSGINNAIYDENTQGIGDVRKKAVLREFLLSVRRDDKALQIPLTVRASSEDIESARKVLEAIANLGEELRKYLLDNFDLNEILVSA